MDRIWMGISPEPTETRVIAMAGAGTTLLKARLSRSPAHPRALVTAANLFLAVEAYVGDLRRDKIHPVFLLDEAHLL